MSIGLYNLKTPKGMHKKKKILGRGSGSGHGKTSTRGTKGQTSRTGHKFYPGFEGGQIPLIQKIPKRGFTSYNPVRYQIINVNQLEKVSEELLTPDILQKYGLIKAQNKPVKILGTGKISRALSIKGVFASKSAKAKIEQAGGKIEVSK